MATPTNILTVKMDVKYGIQIRFETQRCSKENWTRKELHVLITKNDASTIVYNLRAKTTYITSMYMCTEG